MSLVTSPNIQGRFYSEMAQILEAPSRGAVALCTVIRTTGSTPRKGAAKMLVWQEGGQVHTHGTIGGGRVEKEVIGEALAELHKGEAARPKTVTYHLTHSLAMCCGGEMEIFIEPILPPFRLVVCGGGHVAHALVPLCLSLGFSPILVEDLPELGNPERFPDVAQIIDSFDVRDWGVPLDGFTYVVIVTREHALDQQLLEQLLPHKDRLAYLGLIGSARKIAMFGKRLAAKGFGEAPLSLVQAPIGLSIGAETPQEIAVSIAAQLIERRASRRQNQAAPCR